MMSALSRRSMISGLAAAGSLALIGCGSSEKKHDQRGQAPAGRSGSSTPAPQAAAMTVYRDPSCGCCEAWAEIARKAGYQVELIDHPDMAAIKRQYDVPDDLLSCHTTIVSGYAIEGHVPLGDVDRLLRERPTGVKGLAVPGMPRGSPGMEMPDGAKDRFEVLAFDAAGKTSVFSTA
jgi:hypothetical protein